MSKGKEEKVIVVEEAGTLISVWRMMMEDGYLLLLLLLLPLLLLITLSSLNSTQLSSLPPRPPVQIVHSGKEKERKKLPSLFTKTFGKNTARIFGTPTPYTIPTRKKDTPPRNPSMQQTAAAKCVCGRTDIFVLKRGATNAYG